jgi:hypothetical protein
MADQKKNTEIIVPKSAALAEVPEFLREDLGKRTGMEQVEQSDLLLPRLGLCQALSPQRRKSDSAFIPGLEEGKLFNTVTKEIYGDTLEIISLFFFKNRIKYIDIDEGGGIDCISTNGIDGGRISPDGCSICKFSTWGNGEKDDEHGNDAPECTQYHNFMAFVMGDNPTPIAISYKATGLKVSKQLLAAIRMTRLPMYAKKYRVSVVEMQKDKNVWFEKKIDPIGYVDKEVYKDMKRQFQALKDINITVDTTGEAEDVVQGDTGKIPF